MTDTKTWWCQGEQTGQFSYATVQYAFPGILKPKNVVGSAPSNPGLTARPPLNFSSCCTFSAKGAAEKQWVFNRGFKNIWVLKNSGFLEIELVSPF